MRKFFVSTCVLVGLAAVSGPANAATGSIPFGGIVTSICVLTVGSSGVLSPNAQYTSLSSITSGGSTGTLAALTTGTGFRVSASTPSSFLSAPSGGSDNVTFETRYSTSGATILGLTLGNTQSTLAVGLTNISVDLTATKSSGHFSSGNYSAQVVVTCE